MREKRMWQETWLKGIAMEIGLKKGAGVVIRERALLKDYTYITREIRYGVVLELYDHHFYCQMADGSRESFRYNEFLGYEARLIRLKKNDCRTMKNEKRHPKGCLFSMRRCIYYIFLQQHEKITAVCRQNGFAQIDAQLLQMFCFCWGNGLACLTFPVHFC